MTVNTQDNNAISSHPGVRPEIMERIRQLWLMDDTALARLMHDFFCADPEKMYYRELAQVVAFHKTDSKEVLEMSGVFEAFAEEKLNEGILIGTEQGREQGISIGAERAALNLLADGFPHEDVARYTSLPLETVRALAERHEEGEG